MAARGTAAQPYGTAAAVKRTAKPTRDSTAGQRIGLLGGSFNPAHAGHLALSLYAQKALKLDEIWWLVSPQNPLKSLVGMADYATRLAHARKLASHSRIRVLDIERKLGTQFSVDTMRKLKQHFPRARFTWLMGADNLAQFHRWRQWKVLFKLVPIAVFDRAPFSHRSLRMPAPLAFTKRRIAATHASVLPACAPPGWVFIHMRRHAASATSIRNSLGKNAFFRHSNI